MDKNNDEIFGETDDTDHILVKILHSAIFVLAKSVENDNVNAGMVAKNLQVDQAVIIAIELGYFEKEDLDQYLSKHELSTIDNDKLICDTKKSNLKIGFILGKIKQNKPEKLEGII